MMKKLFSVVFVLVFVFCASFSAQAIELKPFQDTDPCCYVEAGGTCEFQTWDTETSYTIADETIATIDENGVLHGLKAGHTTMDVVVFDEEFADWIAGGYSFTQDIEVYAAATALSLGENTIKNTAPFTPDESGYYSFTGCDMIHITGGTVDHWAAANYHDDTEYVAAPTCYLEAGVTYTVSASNYDETYITPVVTVTIAKSAAPATTTTTTATITAAAPDTGDNAHGAAIALLLVCSGAAIVCFGNKRNATR